MSDSCAISRLLIERGAPRTDGTNRSRDHARGSARLGAYRPYKERLTGKRVLLITGGVKSVPWSLRCRKPDWRSRHERQEITKEDKEKSRS